MIERERDSALTLNPLEIELSYVGMAGPGPGQVMLAKSALKFNGAENQAKGAVSSKM